jgi:transcriptional regulator CtsR
MEGIDFRICKKDQFFDAKHLFKQYKEVYYPIDTYKKKKASKGVRDWNLLQSRSENMYKGTIANFDKLFNSSEINMDELSHFMKKNDTKSFATIHIKEITLENIPHKAKLDYMIRKIGGRTYQQVFVHRYVAIDMAMSLSPGFKAIVISVFDKCLNGTFTDNDRSAMLSGVKIEEVKLKTAGANIQTVVPSDDTTLPTPDGFTMVTLDASLAGMKESIISCFQSQLSQFSDKQNEFTNNQLDLKNIIETTIQKRDVADFRKSISNQCSYCMRIMATNSAATNHESHTCAEREFAKMQLNIDGHLLLTLVDAIISEDISNYNEDDLEEQLIHQTVITDRALSNIIIKMPYMKKSTTRGKPATKVWCTYNLKNYKSRMKLFTKLHEKYYLDLKLLVNKATHEFLTNNNAFLQLLYGGIPDDGEYRCTKELTQKRIEMGY